ncbi:MAG: RNA polymerase sigma factor [Elusimicrobiota bacterium]|nr:RNA polymerase sigma factor [Endomicrobiia bacterium]MDW8165078.1 RNA polymerase sigma factor [Elusimicrobiota bacterium]
MEEKQLILLAQQGNIEAFEELIKKYKNDIFNLAFLKVLDINTAEDIAQETIIRIFQKIDTFDFKGSFSSWVYKITYNTILKLSQKLSAENVSIEDKEIKDVDEVKKIEENITHQQIISKLVKIISKLPEELQIVLILHDIQGKKYQEIAEILDINIGTVKSRLFNARKTLKQLCEKENLLDFLE